MQYGSSVSHKPCIESQDILLAQAVEPMAWSSVPTKPSIGKELLQQQNVLGVTQIRKLELFSCIGGGGQHWEAQQAEIWDFRQEDELLLYLCHILADLTQRNKLLCLFI